MGTVKRFDPVTREAKIAEVARLTRLGFSQVEIALRVGVCSSTVALYQRKATQRLREVTVGERQDAVNEKLALLAEVRREAYEAWQASKREGYTRTYEECEEVVCKFCGGTGNSKVLDMEGSPKRCGACGGKGLRREPSRMVEEIRSPEPNNAFLKTILDTIKQEADLLGLEAPKEVKTEGVTHHFDWNVLFTRQQAPDPLEARILREVEGTEQGGGGANPGG